MYWFTFSAILFKYMSLKSEVLSLKMQMFILKHIKRVWSICMGVWADVTWRRANPLQSQSACAQDADTFFQLSNATWQTIGRQLSCGVCLSRFDTDRTLTGVDGGSVTRNSTSGSLESWRWRCRYVRKWQLLRGDLFILTSSWARVVPADRFWRF